MMRPVRVLLVDDLADLRRLVARVLGRDGRFEVVAEAGDGQEAIEAAGLHQPDLVLLDLAMPVMDGLTALPHIRAAAPRAGVVILSGFPQQQMGQMAEGGVAGYIEKGGTPRQLVGEILALTGAINALTAVVAEEKNQTALGTVLGDSPEWQMWAPALRSVSELAAEIVDGSLGKSAAEKHVAIEIHGDRLKVSTVFHEPVIDLREHEDMLARGGLGDVADRWGIDDHPRGKVLWFEVVRPNAEVGSP